MAELELTRTPGDKRLYALAGAGTLRLKGWTSRSATAEAGELRWEISHKGFLKTVYEAADAAGTTVGSFEGRTMRGGGELRWGERLLELRSSSIWRERFALVEDGRELATIEGKSWGKRPVKVGFEDGASIDQGLLLFAAFVVRALAEDASSASTVTVGA